MFFLIFLFFPLFSLSLFGAEGALPFQADYKGTPFEADYKGIPFVEDYKGISFVADYKGIPFVEDYKGISFVGGYKGIPFVRITKVILLRGKTKGFLGIPRYPQTKKHYNATHQTTQRKQVHNTSKHSVKHLTKRTATIPRTPNANATTTTANNLTTKRDHK